MKRHVLALALLLIVAPVVTAHGGRDTQTKQSASYNVEWFSYNYVVQDEFVRFGYNVTDLDSGDKVDMSGTTVEFVFTDDDGSTVDTKDVTLQTHESAYDIGDIRIPGDGVTSFQNNVPLPEGESITFTLDVQGATGGNGGNGGNGNNTTPFPGWIVVPAALAAAVLMARRRRG